MQEIANKLAELLLGAVPTFFIVLGLYGFLRVIFFGPMEKILKERHAATAGAQQAAAGSIATAEAKAAEYASALDQARAEIFRSREAERQKTLQARAALVEKTKAAAAERIRTARAEMDADLEAARTGLRAQTQELAESIIRTVLR